MDATQPIDDQTTRHAALAMPAARIIRTIGLSLALGYLIVLGGSFVRANF